MMAGRNLIFMRRYVLTLVCLLMAMPAWSRVLLRWAQPSIPTAANMGISEVVVPWDDEALIKAARRQGYRVYAEVPVGKAADLKRSSKTGTLAGIVLNPGSSQPSQIEEDLRQL